MEEEKSLKDEIKAINENFNKLLESGKVKGIKAKKIGKMQRKKGYVNYIYIRENGNMETTKVPISEGTTYFDNTPRLATPEYVLNWKGQPTIIQPSWSAKPFSPVENFDNAEKEKMLSVGWRLLANRAELGEIKPKSKISPMVIIAIIAVIGIVAFILLRK